MARIALLFLTFPLGSASLASAQTTVEAQLFVGSALSASLPVTISQDGQPDIRLTAHWDTKPLKPAPYYAARLGIWKGNRGWRFDFNHHKLYLADHPAEVQDFRITNGFNMLTISRAFRRSHLSYSIGAGPVVTYPINTVRGRKLDHDRGLNGYLVSGGTIVGMATRDFRITRKLFVSLDARGSASYVRIPVVDGRADVPNAALHLHVGAGYLLRGDKGGDKGRLHPGS